MRWPPSAFCSYVTPFGSKCHSASQCINRPGVDFSWSFPVMSLRSSAASRISPFPMSPSTEMTSRSFGSIIDSNSAGDNIVFASSLAQSMPRCTCASPANHPVGSGLARAEVRCSAGDGIGWMQPRARRIEICASRNAPACARVIGFMSGPAGRVGAVRPVGVYAARR